MRIVLTTWGYPTPYSYDANGIGIYTRLTARTLVRMGHQVVVCTTHASGMPEVFEDDGVEVHQAPPGNMHWYLHKLPGISRSPVHLLKLYEIGRSLLHKALELNRIWHFEVIEVGPPSPYMYPQLRNGCGMRVVSTIHGCGQLSREVFRKPKVAVDRFWDRAERRAASYANVLVSPSNYVAEFYRSTYMVKPIVLPLPVELLPPRSPSRSACVKILANGGQGYAKGGDVVIRAMHRVLRQAGETQLTVMYSKGNPDFERLAEEFSGRVSLLPAIPRAALEDVYREHDIYLTASRFETFGLSLAEAMASGMAVVVSDIPPHMELTQNGKGGLTFEGGNANALADAVIELMGNRSLREELGEAAQGLAQRNLDPLAVTADRVKAYQLSSNNLEALA